MTTLSHICILCGSEAGERVTRGTDRMLGLPGTYDVIRCLTCGLARTEPQIPEENRAKYYAPEEGAACGRATRVKLYQSRLAGRVNKAVPDRPDRRVLDIGCGEGVLLSMLRGLGWDACGVELGEESSRVARDKGLKVQTGDLFSLQADESSFDAVVMSHVLEHLPEPVDALRRVGALLKPGGLLLLTLPNYRCLERKIFGANWYPWCLPPHLYHFQRKSVRGALTTAGLVPERVTYLPFFFVTQSLRCVLRKSVPWAGGEKAQAEPVPQPVASGAKDVLKTVVFACNLRISDVLGRFIPGEIMEVEARKL